MLWLFAIKLDLLPVGGWDGLFDIWLIGGVIAVPIPDPHLYIPLFTLSIGGFAGIARLVRITALEVQNEDYVRTARAKGLPEAMVQLRHVLPNSLLPIVTVIGFALIGIIEGAYFTEILLGIPGIGPLHLRGGGEPRLRRDPRDDGDRGGRLHRHQPARRAHLRLHRPACAAG